MDFVSIGLFIISAIALLGSPGPAIIALLSIGRVEGLKTGLNYNLGLQVGLAIAAGISALSLFSIFEIIPSFTYALSFCAAGYLIYLSFRIAMAPVGNNNLNRNIPSSMLAGFFLGLTNPKAYIAFISLYASYSIYPDTIQIDIFLKWLLCVLVMIIVDTIWLLIGVSLKQVNFNPTTEKILNVIFGLMIVLATLLAFR